MFRKLVAGSLIAMAFLLGAPTIAGATPVDLGWWNGKDGIAHCVVDWDTGDGNCDTMTWGGTFKANAFQWYTPTGIINAYASGGNPGTDPFKMRFCGRRYEGGDSYTLIRPGAHFLTAPDGTWYRHVQTRRSVFGGVNEPTVTWGPPNAFMGKPGTYWIDVQTAQYWYDTDANFCATNYGNTNYSPTNSFAII